MHTTLVSLCVVLTYGPTAQVARLHGFEDLRTPLVIVVAAQVVNAVLEAWFV